MLTATMLTATTTYDSLLKTLLSTLTLKQPTDNLLAKTVGDNKASAERAMIKVAPKLVTETLPAG